VIVEMAMFRNQVSPCDRREARRKNRLCILGTWFLTQKGRRGAVETKGEYQARVESELEKADSQIETWRAKAEEEDIDPETKTDRQERLAALSRIQTMARSELEDLKRAGEDNWDGLKARIDGLLSELRNALTSSSDRFL
jgi:hypothetical protein